MENQTKVSGKHKYILYYSGGDQRFRIIMVHPYKLNMEDPRILYIFGPENLNLARKIQKNMNLANQRIKSRMLNLEFEFGLN